MRQQVHRSVLAALLVVLAGCSSTEAPEIAAATSSVAASSSAASSAAVSTPVPEPTTTTPAPPPTTAAPSSAATTAAAPSITLAQSADALTKGLTVSASVGGGSAITMLVDTGSNGVVLSRRYLGSGATSMSPAQKFTGFTYSSSGNTYNGEWMTASIQFGAVGGGGYLATTTPIAVRVVDEECKAGTCNSDAATLDVAMLGVGFDRGGDNPTEAALSGPALNPFLQLESMATGAMPQAYIMSTKAIVLGPDAADLAGFSTVQLQKTTPAAGAAGDWQAAPSCVAVPSADIAAQCGTLLLDTGLGYAIVQVPADASPPVTAAATAGDRPTLATGQQVAITVTGLDAPIYSFEVGGAGAPTSVQWGHDLHDGQSFMNISRYALSQHDYLYNASTGEIGFRAAS